MKRDLESDLIEWKNQEGYMPLLLRGARQVGKTYLVHSFGKKHFKNLVELNFEQYPDYSRCFSTRDPQEIISQIEVMTGVDITEGDTLLFLDEIQECPEAIISLRYFKEQMPKLHIIGAGSLLEFAINEPSFRMPVGRVQFLYLRPLSFGEFLDASGHDKLRSYLNQIHIEDSINESIHTKALSLLREYIAIGGMPHVVSTYLKKKNLLHTQKLQSALLMSFRRDFGKYAHRMPHEHLETVFSKAPGLIGKWLKYSSLDPNVRSATLKNALAKLCHAGLITLIHSSSAEGLPFIAHSNEKKCKMLFLDIGLVKRSSNLSLEMLLQDDLMLLNAGALAEQLVGQELLAYFSKEEHNTLFAWARDVKSSHAEVDYLVAVGSNITPIEVKAGSTGSLRSLKILMKEKKLPIGIKVSQEPLALHGNILSIPLYMVESLPRLAQELLS